MASTLTRGQIVSQALQLAGRGQELKSMAETCLNLMLKHWAISKRFPELRKVGDSITLGTGATYVTIPADFGNGMEQILVGTERRPIFEIDFAEFVERGYYPGSTPVTGLPQIYSLDENSSRIWFDKAADQSYSVIPIYYRLPPAIVAGGDGDNSTVWHNDDEAVIQGLIQYIYQYTGDPREQPQSQLADLRAGEYRRGKTGISGGVQRVRLSKQFFRSRK